MRPSSSTDFTVTVDGIGDFVFAKRVMRDEMKIQAEYRRMTDGLDDPGSELSLVATWLAALKVLMVRSPVKMWEDVESVDPLDPDTYSSLMRIYEALREKERSFRPGKGADSAGTGAADVPVGGVPVSPPVRPAAD